MDSMPKSQPLRCLIFVFVIVQFCEIRTQNFDSLMQRVAFYPAPLMISHSPSSQFPKSCSSASFFAALFNFGRV